MEQEADYFGENGIIKSDFHQNKRPININEVDIERIKLSDKKSYGKDSFKCIGMKVALFHRYFMYSFLK